MPSLRPTTATLLYLSASLVTHAAASSDSMAHGLLHKRATYEGCYSSPTPLTYLDSYTYQSSGHCLPACEAANQKVAATTGGGDCWCGDEYPSLDDKVDLSKCDTTCQGFSSEYCGGDGFWTVYPAINGAQVDNYGGSSSSSSTSSSSSSSAATTQAPSSSSAAQTVITSAVSGGQTVLVTVSAQPTSESTGKSSGGGGGSNTAGIAAGVVVGVVAVAAIAAGIYFFIRHKKNKDAEADFKQRNQVADFMRGSNERKPPGTGYSGMSDQRLDPEAGRRNSVGSLADNQDYSRRILRVANPDSS